MRGIKANQKGNGRHHKKHTSTTTIYVDTFPMERPSSQFERSVDPKDPCVERVIPQQDGCAAASEVVATQAVQRYANFVVLLLVL